MILSFQEHAYRHQTTKLVPTKLNDFIVNKNTVGKATNLINTLHIYAVTY